MSNQQGENQMPLDNTPEQDIALKVYEPRNLLSETKVTRLMLVGGATITLRQASHADHRPSISKARIGTAEAS